MVETRDRMKAIAQALADLDSDELQKEIGKVIQTGIDIRRIVRDGLGEGMRLVGERYERGEYFLAELIMAGVTFNEALDSVHLLLGEGCGERIGKVVIGTVVGDLHDIGKNIVVAMLDSSGFEVIDLGVDVTPKRFVDVVNEHRPDVVCLSTLLSVTMPNVRATVEALEEAGLRNNVKILVGGRCLNPEIAREMGADAYGGDAWNAVLKAKALLER